jgi:hypothetical protein
MAGFCQNKAAWLVQFSCRYYFRAPITIMAVTRLKRKDARNRAKSSREAKTIKRLKHVVLVASPFKGESGIILEDQQA